MIDSSIIDRPVDHPGAGDVPIPDASEPDAAMIDAPEIDAFVEIDANSIVCKPAFADCASYDDYTAPTADRTITFPFLSYAPKCMKISAGQSVTFSGNFGVHPLAQACGTPGAITNGTSGSATFTFATPDVYGYYCENHGSADGSGMAGSILVVP